MQSSVDLKLLLFPLILALPSLLVTTVGLGYSVFKYRVHPKISTLAIVALLINGIITTVSIFQPSISYYFATTGSTPETMTFILGTIGTLSSIFNTIALAMLLFAVFSERKSD